MKSVRSLKWGVRLAMASIFAVATTGLAAGGINEAVGHPVKSREEAERPRVGSLVRLAYATRKTMWIANVDKEKGMVCPSRTNCQVRPENQDEC
jgi:hypothetical protein